MRLLAGIAQCRRWNRQLVIVVVTLCVYFTVNGLHGGAGFSRGQEARQAGAVCLNGMRWYMNSSGFRPGRKASRPKRRQRDQRALVTHARREAATIQDFVVAVPSQLEREQLFTSGRAARVGMRTYLATSYKATREAPYRSTANETWTYYPDDSPLRSWYSGDSRAALLPFLAFKHMYATQPFKWLFYGDDDTVFFPNAAVKVVEHLDSGLPYFLTDNIWYSTQPDASFHPHPSAPICLPCTSRKRAGHLRLRACPCRPETLCRNAGFEAWDAKGCGSRSQLYSIHGGAGALVSAGLLQSIKFEDMEACVLRQHDSGGDAFLTTCLWELGIGLTSPQPLRQAARQAVFDPSPPPLHPDDYTIYKATHVLAVLLLNAAGRCAGLCQELLDNTVSLHLRARRTGGSQLGTAAMVRLFSRLSRFPAASSAEDAADDRSAEVAKVVDAAVKHSITLTQVLVDKSSVMREGSDLGQLSFMRDGKPQTLRDRLLFAAARVAADQALETVIEAVRPFAEFGYETEDCETKFTTQKSGWLDTLGWDALLGKR